MRSLIIILFAFISITSFAQRPQGVKPENMPKDGSIIGRVLDNESLKPVEYANIGLYKLHDSSLVTGTISDKQGFFKLTDLSYGRYYVEVKFIGFEKYISDVFMINPKKKTIQLSEIVISASARQLGEIEVVEQRNHIEYKLDKKIVNVSQDIIATGGTAVDVLENIPSVETDIDGNVSLRGSSDFLVLIDGKPSIFESSDALQQIPASTIEKIEIITNPSAKYDPDGVSGIINVITKKNVLKGINGILNLSVGTKDKYSGNFTISYKTNKFNFYGGINYSDQTRYGTSLRESRTSYNDTSYYLISDSDRNRARYRKSVKMGFDYYFNPANTLSFSGSLGEMGFIRSSSSNYHDYTFPFVMDDFYIGENSFEISRKYYRFNLDYNKKFSDEGHELKLSAYKSLNNGYGDDFLFEKTTDDTWSIILLNSFQQKTYEMSNGDEYRLKMDYSRPFQNGKLESGYQFRYEFSDQSFELEQFDTSLNNWEMLNEFSNDLDFTRNIQSLYFIYSGSMGIFRYQGGLRTEYTNRMIEQIILNEEYPVKRLDWFPSFHLSLDLSDNYQAQASYGRRIHRPRNWYLDPFPNYFDQRNVRIGNPALEPEFIDSYELNLQRKFGKSFVSLESYYRQTNNKITRARILGDNNIMTHTFSNLDHDYSLGFELMANIQMFRWWRFTATANVFRYQVEGDIEGLTLVQNTNTWSTRINSSFILKTKTRIQLSGYYSGPSVTVQGDRGGFYFTNIGVKQDLLNRKLSITLQVRDIFGTMKHSFTSTGVDFYFFNEFRREPRVVTLQLTYILNNYKKKERNGVNGEMDFDEGDI